MAASDPMAAYYAGEANRGKTKTTGVCTKIEPDRAFEKSHKTHICSMENGIFTDP